LFALAIVTSAASAFAADPVAKGTAQALPVIGKVPDHRIVHEVRMPPDGPLRVFILVDPVNPAAPEFKPNMRALVRKVAKDHRVPITIEIFDNGKAMDMYYRGGILFEHKGPYSKEEVAFTDTHAVCLWGEVDGDKVLNELLFFPGAPSNSLYSKNASEEKFDPRN
jgi:hypothetical protein